MNNLIQKCIASSKELKNTNSMVGMSLLIALSVVLSFFSFQLGEYVRIGPGFVISAILGMMYGPVAGGVAAGVGDIVKYIVKPSGEFFPGFTITAILGGAIYGFFFYKNNFNIKRAIFAKLTISIFLNSILNTVWLSMLYGKAMYVIFPIRLIKNMCSLPIEIFILCLVLSKLPYILRKNHSFQS